MRPLIPVLSCCLVLLAAPHGWSAEDKDDLSQRVQTLLKTHCYRCHGQDGRAEGNLNYILDVPKLLQRKKLIAGKPKDSKLYRKIARGEMPPEDDNGIALAPLRKEDIAVFEKWIAEGARDFSPRQPEQKFITPDAILTLISEDLELRPQFDRQFSRYFTLTHLANAGLPDDQLQTYRFALSKLINSLSWKRKIAVPQAIDPGRTILRIDLRDYDWTKQTWERLIKTAPYNVRHAGRTAQNCSKLSGASLPFIRGDWFVVGASQPPLYHDVLQLPAHESELTKRLGIDVEEHIRQRRVVRAGFNSSGVSQNNRLLERHESPHGAYWRSYDFANSIGGKNLFDHPLGPSGPNAFQHDGGEIIFNLPNGLQAYLLVDGKGRRIDRAPNTIVKDDKRPDSVVVNGLSCMSCHNQGMIEKADQIRKYADKRAGAYDKDDLEIVRALYPGEVRLNECFEEDARRFAVAVEQAGGKRDANGRIVGSDPIAGLVRLFEEELDLKRAAAEVGVESDKLAEALRRSRRLKPALRVLAEDGGTIKRDAFVAAFGELVEELRLGTFVPPGADTVATVQPALPDSPKQRHKVVALDVAFASDGKFLAVLLSNGAVMAGDEMRQTRLESPAGARATCLAFSRNSKRLAIGDLNGNVTVWDRAELRKPIWTSKFARADSRPGINGLAFSSDGRTLIAGDGEGNLLCYDAANGQQRQRVYLALRQILSIASAPEDGTLAVATEAYLRGGTPLVHRIDLATGKEMSQLKAAGPFSTASFFDPVTPRSLAFSPDGRTLAAGHQLWDWKTGNVRVELPLEKGDRVVCLAFSPDGKTLATGNLDGVQLWDPATGRKLGAVAERSSRIASVVFTPIGREILLMNGLVLKSVELRQIARPSSQPPARLPENTDEEGPIEKYYRKYRRTPSRPGDGGR